MKRFPKTWMLTIVALLLGCAGENPLVAPTSDAGLPSDPYAPCTDPKKCCLECLPDIETGHELCRCEGLWDCSKNPKKCESSVPVVPPGGGSWTCSWTEFKYTCQGGGKQDAPPPGPLDGGSSWYCHWSDNEFVWECTRDIPPTPPNTPQGVGGWTCTVQSDQKVVCERKEPPPPPPPTDGGTPPITDVGGGGGWTCTTDKETGRVTCKKDDLPPGGSNWACNVEMLNGVKTWVCFGNADTPPGGGGWDCTAVEKEFNRWECTKPDAGAPPGGGYYACVQGSEFGGTVCEQVPVPPLPPDTGPRPGETCLPGEKRWCDGAVACGWGIVMCDPATGTWKTKLDPAMKKLVFDCSEELAAGKRPKTTCACYHFFFNPTCCERPDCVLPSGTDGQTCPASKGKLCDYCDPRAPECTEPGAKCIVSNTYETYCGRACSKTSPCPSGYQCYPTQNQYQCVPSDLSCYH
jgi:hypothetical protein